MSATSQPAAAQPAPKPSIPGIPCPHCGKAQLTCVAGAPFARGFIIAVQYGTKRFAGCPACVGKKLRLEAVESLFLGCFSVTSLILNIFFIPYNLIQSFFVRPNPKAVSKLLDDVGVPEPGKEYRISDAYYAAAGAMIRADGKTDVREINAAKAIGARVLADYSEAKFTAIALATRGFPATAEIATVLRVYLKPEGQALVLRSLLEIGRSDGELNPKEDKFLEQLAAQCGYGKDAYRKLRDAGAAAAAPAAKPA